MHEYSRLDHDRALKRLARDLTKIKDRPEPRWCCRCQDRPARVGGFCDRCVPNDPGWHAGVGD